MPFLDPLSAPEEEKRRNHCFYLLNSCRNDVKVLKPYQIDPKFVKIDQEMAEICFRVISAPHGGPHGATNVFVYLSNLLNNAINHQKELIPYQIDSKFVKIDRKMAEICYLAFSGTPWGCSGAPKGPYGSFYAKKNVEKHLSSLKVNELSQNLQCKCLKSAHQSVDPK